MPEKERTVGRAHALHVADLCLISGTHMVSQTPQGAIPGHQAWCKHPNKNKPAWFSYITQIEVLGSILILWTKNYPGQLERNLQKLTGPLCFFSFFKLQWDRCLCLWGISGAYSRCEAGVIHGGSLPWLCARCQCILVFWFWNLHETWSAQHMLLRTSLKWK